MQVNILVTYIPIDKESDFFVCLVFYLATFSEYQYYLFFYKKNIFSKSDSKTPWEEGVIFQIKEIFQYNISYK